MAEGMSVTTANSILDAIGNGDSFSIGAAYLQLHIGAPGAAGTANPAVETTRKLISWGTPAGGSYSNDAAMVWTNVAAAEDYTHWTIWTAASGGSFVGSGTVSASAVLMGQTFTIPIGAVVITIPVAS